MAGAKYQSEMEAIEKIQNQSLKKILQLPVTTRQLHSVIKRQWTSTAIFHVKASLLRLTTNSILR